MMGELTRYHRNVSPQENISVGTENDGKMFAYF